MLADCPQHLLHELFRFADLADLPHWCATCSSWNKIAAKRSLWSSLFKDTLFLGGLWTKQKTRERV
jgi:hypothetical protein